MSELSFKSEQEASVAILFAAALNNGNSLTQSQIENLSRMMVLCSRFKGSDLNELTVHALSVQSVHGSRKVIEIAAPVVEVDFKETLFAMACEVITANGKIDQQESEILAMIALYMGLSMEIMKMILTTYLIRNKWNVQIIEENEG